VLQCMCGYCRPSVTESRNGSWVTLMKMAFSSSLVACSVDVLLSPLNVSHWPSSFMHLWQMFAVLKIMIMFVRFVSGMLWLMMAFCPFLRVGCMLIPCTVTISYPLV